MLRCAGSLLILCALGFAQEPQNAARVRLNLDRARTLGSVLMIAAHPDDENTALLAYLARGRNLRTAYLSVTRGEGGQNLIGSEQGDYMGLIRTQELLAARRIDGAEQFFTRAIDFGFSKTAEETLAKWGREQVLGDVVWTIRRFQPDVIVLRFSGTPRDGHGHHQSSAILGKEAFDAAADPARYPEQLQWVKPWRAKRLMYNGGGGGPGGPGGRGGPGEPGGRGAAPGGRGAPPAGRGAPPAGRGGPPPPGGQGAANAVPEGPPPPGTIQVDTGDYSPLLGLSYGEIAGQSRSMHRSQGMGSPERRGTARNSLNTIGGDLATQDLMDGVETSWKRVPSGAAVADALDRAGRDFDIAHPEKMVPALQQARTLIAAINDPWATRKLAEVDELIAASAGIWVDGTSARAAMTPGSEVRLTLSALSRARGVPVKLDSVRMLGIPGADTATVEPGDLAFNQPLTRTVNLKIPAGQPYTQPYWLREPHSLTMYTVTDREVLGLGEAPALLRARFRLTVAGSAIELERPIAYRWVDAVRGELTRPALVAPAVAVEIADPALLFPDRGTRKIDVQVRALAANSNGELSLEAPAGWRIAPASRPFQIAEENGSVSLAFDVTPPAAATTGELRAVAKVGGATVRHGVRVVDYEHIPPQTVFPPAASTLVRSDVKLLARRIGYVMGAGDEVPDALRQLGAQVTMLTDDDLSHGDFNRFDAVVTGVRAFATRRDLSPNFQRLLDFVQQGGTLVVQYNRQESGPGAARGTRGPERLGPYPIQISNSRVTVEEAPMKAIKVDHPVLQAPNRITDADFAGWVQERGLYYPNQFDAHYDALWESNDPGEQPLKGATLYTRYGKGVYVYTSLAWFRQLPAGVPGAFRIFANFLSASKVTQ